MIPLPPQGSVIERIDHFDGDWLAWPIPSFGPGRYFWAAVFGFFTCAWAAVIVAAALSGGLVFSMIGWLIAWAVLGAWVPLGHWLTLRPMRPESVLMTAYEMMSQTQWKVRVISIIDIALIKIIDGSFRSRTRYRWPLLCSLWSGHGIRPVLSE